MSGYKCQPGSTAYPQVRFSLFGMVGCPDFQICLTQIELLRKRYPERFFEPFIRPMLEVEWYEFIMKAQRSFGGPTWTLCKPLLVFVNGQPLGGGAEFDKFISKWYRIRMIKDFSCMAQQGHVEMYAKFMESGRKFVYFGVAMRGLIIGHLIFMLYADVVPKTCRRFLKRCISKSSSYRGTRILRRVDNAWLQCAHYSLPIYSTINENYRIPHNRRGVLTMCNNGINVDNSIQFAITLDATPWMDFKYVAIGQLVQGEHILRRMETIKTKVQTLTEPVTIPICGEITLDDTVEAMNFPDISEYLNEKPSPGRDRIDSRDVPSFILLDIRYHHYMYCYRDDINSHLPLWNLKIPFRTPSITSVTQPTILKNYIDHNYIDHKIDIKEWGAKSVETVTEVFEVVATDDNLDRIKEK